MIIPWKPSKRSARTRQLRPVPTRVHSTRQGPTGSSLFETYGEPYQSDSRFAQNCPFDAKKSFFVGAHARMINTMPTNRDADWRALRTRNLDEAIDAVTRVYCPHTVEVVGRPRGVDAVLKVTHSTFQPLVKLSYSAPVKIDAQNFSRLFLMMHCARGAASTAQEHRTAEWKAGETMPFSANFDTQLWFDGAFVQKSVRLDMERLEAQCARWLGPPTRRAAAL
jgi:hypothetical protein